MDSNKIILVVAQILAIPIEELLNRGKRKEQLYARYIAMAILREEGYSANDIAKIFTNWTRNCIANHCKDVFNDLIQYNREFKDMYLLAVKAVEDIEYESKNDTSAT